MKLFALSSDELSLAGFDSLNEIHFFGCSHIFVEKLAHCATGCQVDFVP